MNQNDFNIENLNEKPVKKFFKTEKIYHIDNIVYRSLKSLFKNSIVLKNDIQLLYIFVCLLTIQNMIFLYLFYKR
jgi:hypothetical protein